MSNIGTGEIGSICATCQSELNHKGEAKGYLRYCLENCTYNVVFKDNKRVKGETHDRVK